LVALSLIAALTGCDSQSYSMPSPRGPNTPESAPSVDAKTATATKAALAAYAGYLADARVAESIPDPNHPALEKHLADPLLTRVRLTISAAKQHGAMRTGTLVSDPRVTAVSLDAVPQTVTIQDCLDASGYKLVFIQNRTKEVPGHAAGRYVATATASRYPDGRWLVNTGAAHPDQPC
jgi:hypothetical protein